MKRFNKVVLSVVVVVALMVFCLIGWDGSPFRIKRTETLVGPDNKVYLLILNRASLDEIMSAAKSDLGGTFSFCSNGETLLALAVEQKRPDVVRGLLDIGASPNDPGTCSQSVFDQPLATAVSMDEVEMVKLLLEHGADPNLRGAFGVSAVDMARDSRNPEIKALIEGAVKATSSPR